MTLVPHEVGELALEEPTGGRGDLGEGILFKVFPSLQPVLTFYSLEKRVRYRLVAFIHTMNVLFMFSDSSGSQGYAPAFA
jgi:hypothetical protein